ncbi:MAG: hypothetical protein OQK79_09345 [Rhodanobacter sp.]|jgi:hypothetical protein|nr:hypothetical protein [Rhodanobacter sp.]
MKEITRLLADECDMLRQLCSRNRLTITEADSAVGAALEQMGLALMTLTGFWVPTSKGYLVNAQVAPA